MQPPVKHCSAGAGIEKSQPRLPQILPALQLSGTEKETWEPETAFHLESVNTMAFRSQLEMENLPGRMAGLGISDV